MLPSSHVSAYLATLRLPTYEATPYLQVINPATGRVIAEHWKVQDGSLTLDRTQRIKRSGSVTLYDPSHELDVDTDDPFDGVLTEDRHARLMLRIKSPLLPAEGIDLPLHTGVVSNPQRKGAALSVELRGKECLWPTASWVAREWAGNTLKSDLIREILINIIGEPTVVIPRQDDRLPKKGLTLARGEDLGKLLGDLTAGMGMEIIYRADGVPVLREPPDDPAFVVEDGEGGTLVEAPSVSTKTSDVFNAVRVSGAKSAGRGEVGKKQIVAERVAPRDHPLSPWNLGQGEQPRYLAMFVDDTNIRTFVEAGRVADRELREGLLNEISVTASVKPLWHVEPGDLIAWEAASLTAETRPAQMSLSLRGPMSIGSIARQKPKNQIRR